MSAPIFAVLEPHCPTRSQSSVSIASVGRLWFDSPCGTVPDPFGAAGAEAVAAGLSAKLFAIGAG